MHVQLLGHEKAPKAIKVNCIEFYERNKNQLYRMKENERERGKRGERERMKGKGTLGLR